MVNAHILESSSSESRLSKSPYPIALTYGGGSSFSHQNVQLGLSPLDWSSAVPTVSAQFVTKSLHKNVGDPIDKPYLITYIMYIRLQRS